MDAKLQKKALNYSIIDGAFSAVMDSVAGGIFLTGFALKVLHAEASQIGILASLPLFANFAQIFGSYIIEKTGERKFFCFINMLLGRLLWGLIIMLPFKIFAPIADWRIWILVGVIALSNIFQALSGIGWLVWISDIVPANIRGTFFGKRNMVTSGCGMIVALLGGKFITEWSNHHSEESPYGFVILFAVGLAAGLIASWFILRIPDIEKSEREKTKFNFSVFLKPLKDKNFLMLTLVVAAWSFAVQFAAPFYAVFMINNLKIDFSNIAIFTTFSTLATLFMMKIWGPISDKLGNKPVMLVSGWILIAVPFIWVIAIPHAYYLPVLIAFLLTGAFTAGAILSQSNILIKLSPQDGRSAYLALYAAIVGLTSAVAPIIGGSLSSILKNISFIFFTYQITNLHIIFIVSSILQALTIFFILKVKEPAASTPVAVIMQLKNDLNPQTGIVGTTDFVMVELKKGHNTLKQIDDVTDNIADISEENIKKALTKVEDIVLSPFRKLRDFLKDKDD